MPGENGGVASESLFNRYTQKACIFSCALERTIDELKCVPWNYVREGGVSWKDGGSCLSILRQHFDVIYIQGYLTLSCKGFIR